MTERKLRRNDIVHVPSVRADEHGNTVYGECCFFGRVNRRIDADHVEVICSGRHITVFPDSVLNRDDYKGTWVPYGPRKLDEDYNDIRQRAFLAMSSLRKLKQRASFYYPEVWARNRKRIAEGEEVMSRKARMFAEWRKRGLLDD